MLSLLYHALPSKTNWDIYTYDRLHKILRKTFILTFMQFSPENCNLEDRMHLTVIW